MSEHLDDWGGHVGGPHGDHPLSMTHETDSIVGVVAQGVTGAHLGPVLGDSLAGAGVLHISAQTAGSNHTAARQKGMGCRQMGEDTSCKAHKGEALLEGMHPDSAKRFCLSQHTAAVQDSTVAFSLHSQSLFCSVDVVQ